MTKYEQTIKIIERQIEHWKEKRKEAQGLGEIQAQTRAYYLTRQSEDELLLEIIKIELGLN